jgi:hypothetical protein
MLRCDAGLLKLAVGGRAGPRRRSGYVLALGAAVMLALAAGAVTATPALALTEHVECNITVYNYTPYTMRLYDSAVNGSGDSPTQSIAAGGVGSFYADSWFPIHNHCSMHLWWELQTADGSGWSQSMETYVYDPNSGHNNAWASMNGAFAQRTTGTDIEGGPFWAVQDASWDEGLEVDACAPACPPPYSAFTASADPLRRAPEAATRVKEPKQVPSLLHRRDLIGRGWRRVTQLADLGHLGGILKATKVSASCQGKNKETEPSALKEGLSAFSLRSGAEFIGAAQGIYARTGQARQMINDAVSARSITCLARAFTSKRFHTRVTTQRRSVTYAGRHLTLNRLTIRTHSGARVTRTDYLDVLGILRGNANALMMLASDKQPPAPRGELAAVTAVVRRLP